MFLENYDVIKWKKSVVENIYKNDKIKYRNKIHIVEIKNKTENKNESILNKCIYNYK